MRRQTARTKVSSSIKGWPVEWCGQRSGDGKGWDAWKVRMERSVVEVSFAKGMERERRCCVIWCLKRSKERSAFRVSPASKKGILRGL